MIEEQNIPLTQKIEQNITGNSGNTQNISSGGDSFAKQINVSVVKDSDVSQSEVVELISNIKSAFLEFEAISGDELEDAKNYIELAKKEAANKSPNKKRVLGNLEGAIDLVENLDKTAESSKKLIQKLREPLVKLAAWLGVAATHFFG